MNIQKQFKPILALITIVALGTMAYKGYILSHFAPVFDADATYDITYRYLFKTDDGPTFVRAYLPKNSGRQQIFSQKNKASKGLSFSKRAAGPNIQGHWSTTAKNSYETLSYAFSFKGKAQSFEVPPNFAKATKGTTPYLAATKNIQSTSPIISKLASTLTTGSQTDRASLKAIFDYVHGIPSAPIISLTDALSALERNQASCNGKSRLFVALLRNLGYAARIKGGIILNPSNKRTSHAWTEVQINGQWVPFDALNGHFAHVPENYLELYEGDLALVAHSPGIAFDYSYEIKAKESLAWIVAGQEGSDEIAAFSLWGLVKNKSISKKNLFLLLMLPLGGLLVALLRTVVGIRTFGVFLPVLIAFALLETGFSIGILLFLFLILFVGLITRPFDAMGLLHTPKLVISLTLMVMVMTLGNYLGIAFHNDWLSALTLFPTIILTVSAERFSKLIVEDGFQKATGTLLQTLLAVALCFTLFSIKGLDNLLILFPEVLLIIISACMLLGRYMGLRWTELIRFKPLLQPKFH